MAYLMLLFNGLQGIASIDVYLKYGAHYKKNIWVITYGVPPRWGN